MSSHPHRLQQLLIALFVVAGVFGLSNIVRIKQEQNVRQEEQKLQALIAKENSSSVAQRQKIIAPLSKRAQSANTARSKPDLKAANRWLGQQAKEVKSVEVTYGSDWPGEIWKTLWITDRKCIQKTLASLDCRGDLENGRGPGSDDGLPNYDTHYRFAFNYIDPKKPQDAFGIYRSSYRPGVYYIVRGFLGSAETDSKSVEQFHSLINKCFSKSKIERH